jgi:Flp pilus assembly secretin CpaC
MLFLAGKGKDATGAAGGPAAALTIHPSLPENASSVEALQATEAPALLALNDSPRTSEIPAGDEVTNKDSHKVTSKPIQVANAGKQLLAQLAPDQLIAQADQPSVITATPIPPVVTGTVDLEEFKTTNVIDLKVSQSRTFKLKNKIVRTSISDPSIAEPVVVAENQMVLLGKSPGGATLVIWDDAGNSVAIDLRVTRDYSQLQSTLREIDPRIIVKTFTVGGSDRVLLLGDVDHPESIIRAFSAANVFMDDRGMVVQVANSRLLNARIGEQGASGSTGGGGGQAGAFAQLGSVDRYTFFGNLNNNIGKAQVITSDGGRVTSLVKVRKVPLIVLHVTFMEMNTSAVRELGVQLGMNFTSGGFGFAVGGNNNIGGSISPQLLTTNPGITGSVPTGASATSNLGYIAQPPSFLSANTVNLTTAGGTTSLPITGFGLGVLNTVPALIGQSVLLGAPGGASFSPGGLANLYTSIANITSSTQQRFGINPTVQGIISHSRARLLAEPTLVTISGERAAFLAGGEIPILQAIATAGAAQQSVTFEPFGMRINMIPVLLENGTINLEVSPEERLISNAFPLNVPGSTTTIPGFTTRKAQTIVEMKPGQELFISGLVSSNTGRELDKTPVLGEIPVLGALYRSKAFAKNESELVIAVRPEVILPGTPGQLKLPEEIGRVEGPRDMNLFQVEPTVIDERHYTSGRSERHQKTSPTLPEGSPIPDNN